MRCPRCEEDNPSHAKFCLECGAPVTGTNEIGPQAALHGDLERTLTEALEQQTATSEILRVISNSRNDVPPVFEAIAESAARLCHAQGLIVSNVPPSPNRSMSIHSVSRTVTVPSQSSTSVWPSDDIRRRLAATLRCQTRV